MALIQCPECKREGVSDSAEACPACGYNVKKATELRKGVQGCLILILIVLAGALVTPATSDSKANAPASSSESTASPLSARDRPASTPREKEDPKPVSFKITDSHAAGLPSQNRWVTAAEMLITDLPGEEQMKVTAARIWGRSTYSEHTVFLHVPGGSGGAYGIAVFSPEGLESFRINEAGLLQSKWDRSGIDWEAMKRREAKESEKPPRPGDWIDPNDLRPGWKIRLSRETPVVPESAMRSDKGLEETLRAIASFGKIPAGSVVLIRGRHEQDKINWYVVTGGYVNPGALYGQKLELVGQ